MCKVITVYIFFFLINNCLVEIFVFNDKDVIIIGKLLQKKKTKIPKWIIRICNDLIYL